MHIKNLMKISLLLRTASVCFDFTESRKIVINISRQVYQNKLSINKLSVCNPFQGSDIIFCIIIKQLGH